MIPRDKQLHAAAGFLTAFIPAALGFPTAGFALSVVIGAGKEVWDHYHPPHVADALDLLATVLGGIAGAYLGWML